MSKKYMYEINVFSEIKYRVHVIARDEDEAWELVDLNNAQVLNENLVDMEIVLRLEFWRVKMPHE